MRRSSAQFYMSAEDHIRNEVNHERHLTETSRLTSSWVNLRLSGNEKQESSDCGFSSPGSSGSSPVAHRPNSFSGPLMISVTCSSSNAAAAATPAVVETKPSVATTATTSATATFSRSSSCYPSPVASPVSSRVQCYSPGIGLAGNFSAKKRTASVSSGSSASPLILNISRGKKRNYHCLQVGAGNRSSTDGSRESSPEPPSLAARFGKVHRVSENPTACASTSIPPMGSPPQDSYRWTPPVSIPSSPTPVLPSSFYVRMASNSPSTTSLPSPLHSNLSTGLTNSPNPVMGLPQPPEFVPPVDAKPRSPSSFSCPESAVTSPPPSDTPSDGGEK